MAVGDSSGPLGESGLRWSSLSEIWQRDSNPLTDSRQLFPEAHYFPLFSQRAVGVEVSPELDKEESVLRSVLKQILESSILLWELVIDLSDVNRL